MTADARHSVAVHNSVRAAVVLGLAVLIADLSDVQESFWVILGALAVLRTSDALFAAMVADARRAEEELASGGPGGQTGNGSVACAAGSHPAKPALRPSHSRADTKPRRPRRAA